jgi:FAD/FMN-containing dehydrogenase/Fe-S oxidoreductase
LITTRTAAESVPLPLSSHAKPVDTFERAADLENELKRTVTGEVRFDRGSRAIYATDGSNYRQAPIGVVVPRDSGDVAATFAACRQFGAPILARGAGTSLAGQCCNVAVVLDFSKYMNRILELDPSQQVSRVQPGLVLDVLRQQAEQHHLTFAPDPSTHDRCTIGGMIGNNSCGSHSLLGGKTVDNVHELRVVLYDGTEFTIGATPEAELHSIIQQGGRRGTLYAQLKAIRDKYADLIRRRFPRIPRRVSGYNLDELLPENGFHVARALVGSEGTCVTVLEARLRLIPSPRHRVLVSLGYTDAYCAADHVMEILESAPIALEGFEGSIVDGLRRKKAPNLELLPDGHGFLLVEFGADDLAEATARAEQLVDRLRRLPDAPDIRLHNSVEAKLIWRIRESGPRAAAFAPGAPPEWEGWDDAAVAPEKLGGYLREFRKLMDEYRYRGAFYGHFGHGCIHTRISFDLETETGIRKYAEFIGRAADLVVSYGGSLSGEHGDGQSRGALLPKMFGPEIIQAFREFKRAWDPDNNMNPGKVVDPYLPTENLRLGADYNPLKVVTHFRYPEDDGSLAKASLRCIGLGACRKDAATMCPSYMVTREELHSTRGRAHMLFEMLQGEVIAGGWTDEHVKESLELCLSCKACKAECPANVDLATYRAEFLAHYYDVKRRPLHAYAFGMIDRWARLASHTPRLANFLVHAPGMRHFVRWALDVASPREMPQFAAENFLDWARATHAAARRDSQDSDSASTRAAPVILWVDTFSNYFHPEVARAALAVLSSAGFRVLIARQHYCCGRPLYDFGMVQRAKQYLIRVLEAFGAQIDAGLPFVVLEPSCASVFRDELGNLFPAEERATRLRAQTFLLSEFLQRYAPTYRPAPQSGAVLLHGHCHQKALMKLHDEESLLRATGASVQTLDSGCCGMAGAFGFNKDTYGVSQAIGERVLLPAVRSAPEETLIVADGFSCREQILQATGRRAHHLSEVLTSCAAAQLAEEKQNALSFEML